MIKIIPLVMLCLSANAGTESGSDPEAESLFGKMADKIRAAKTVQIVCQGSFKTAGFEAEIKATLLLKEGNKTRLELDSTGIRDGQPHTYSIRMISDGSKIRVRERKGPWTEFKTTPHWNEQVVTNITRGGFPSGLELARFKEEGQSEAAAMAFRPVAPPADYVLWSREQLNGKEVLPIEFKGKNDSEFTKDSSTILWLLASNGLPAKRMMVVRSDRTLTVIENYDKFLLNEVVDDSAFAPAKEQ